MRQKQVLEESLFFETFKYRAQELRGHLILCEWCLRKRRRCQDSRRPWCGKSWKLYKKTQWTPWTKKS